MVILKLLLFPMPSTGTLFFKDRSWTTGVAVSCDIWSFDAVVRDRYIIESKVALFCLIQGPVTS